MPVPPAAERPELAHPRAIVVRTPNWLGDLMMSTAFLGALLERFPDVPVHLVVRKGFEALPLPHRGRMLPFDKRAQRAGAFGGSLRGRGYTHLFVLPPSLSSAWMAWRSGIPYRIGYRGQGRAPLLRPALRHGAPPRSIHLAEEYLRLLAPWDVAPTPERLRLQLRPDAEWVARHLPPAVAAESGWVVLAPGAEYGPAKQWPAERYREVARALAARGRRVVVAGLAGDRPLAREILADAPGGVELCGETALPQLVALLARAALVVSNDSGAMHIAAALGVPQVAVFGSTNDRWTGPLNPRATVLHRHLPCSPCYARVCPLGHTNCLKEIAADEVVAAAHERLGAAAVTA